MATTTTQAIAPLETIRRTFEQLERRDADALLPYLDEDVVEDWPVIGRLRGARAVRDHFAAMFAAVPDLRIVPERMAAEGGTVFVHWHAKGTFTGTPYYGVAATGREVDVRGNDCFTVRDGRVTANFVAYDGVGFAVQVGLLPAHGSRTDRAMTAAANLRTRIRTRRRSR